MRVVNGRLYVKSVVDGKEVDVEMIERAIIVLEIHERDDGCYILTSSDLVSDDVVNALDILPGIISVMRGDTDHEINFKATANLGMGNDSLKTLLGTILIDGHSAEPVLVLWTGEDGVITETYMFTAIYDPTTDVMHFEIHQVRWPGHRRLKVTRR